MEIGRIPRLPATGFVRHDNRSAVRLYESGGYQDWPRRFMTRLLA